LVSGDGNDEIIAGNSGGMSILIGGKGSDRLIGNGAGDILIGDYTDFDDPCDPAHPDNEEMLCALRDAWTNPNANYNARSAAVQAILAGHVHPDGAADTLTGSSGADLFYLSFDDKITGRHKDETIVPVV
jgi:Ca2+-binding RTX toxin-like protein